MKTKAGRTDKLERYMQAAGLGVEVKFIEERREIGRINDEVMKLFKIASGLVGAAQ